MKYHYMPIQLLKLKSLTIPSTFEDMEQLEFSFIAGEKFNHFEDFLAVFGKVNYIYHMFQKFYS